MAFVTLIASPTNESISTENGHVQTAIDTLVGEKDIEVTLPSNTEQVSVASLEPTFSQKRLMDPVTEAVEPKKMCIPLLDEPLKADPESIPLISDVSISSANSTFFPIKSEPCEQNDTFINSEPFIITSTELIPMSVNSSEEVNLPLIDHDDSLNHPASPSMISYEAIKADPLAALKAVLSRGSTLAFSSKS